MTTLDQPTAATLTGATPTLIVTPSARTDDGTTYAVVATPTADEAAEPMVSTRRTPSGDLLPEVVLHRDEDGQWNVAWESLGSPGSVEAILHAAQDEDGDPERVKRALARVAGPGVLFDATREDSVLAVAARPEGESAPEWGSHQGLNWVLGQTWDLAVLVHDGQRWGRLECVPGDLYASAEAVEGSSVVAGVAREFAEEVLGVD